ncbi:MAG: phage major capsid protein [Sphingorhabdus sp.]|uniref:phage major capsid protein n=1 Tax=Sphingorhabdus sp. TaxID=1902408 RepID=UPI003CAF1D00
MDYEVKADPLEAAFEAAAVPAAILRPQLAAGDAANPARSAFVEGYLRKGREVELKSFAGNVPADGGYAVPKEIDAVIDATLKSISPIRAVANVVQVGSAGYRKLVTTNGVASGWASEVAARPTTATPTFNEIVPSFGELYANPAATQAMLDDAQFDVEAWLADEIATQFAKAEGTAFVNGDGVDKPKGFLTYTAVATGDATRTFGQLQYVPVGAASDFPATNPQDKLLDLVHALRAPYRQGAVWVMNSATLAKIRKFKTSDGAFVWTPGLVTGQPDTLLGYPVVESEDMPDIAANSMPIAFGNFRAGYLIAERSETNILRDPYSNKPYVNFYATKRIGGAVSNSEAIKLLRIAAS